MATLITGSGVDKVIDGSIVDADIVGVSSSKLTGALPAVDGSALTGVAPTKATIDALGIAASSITGALPVIDGSNLTGVSGGKVLQVVSDWDATEYTVSQSAYTDYINPIITPIATGSSFLVTATLSGIYRQNTGGAVNNYFRSYVKRTGGSGGLTQVQMSSHLGYFTSNATHDFNSNTVTFVDTPTYTLGGTLQYRINMRCYVQSGNFFVNQWDSSTSSLTITEIGA